ncbi:mas-related G-protein coupled receptor member B2-like [Acomys russatus]|uniref:mas-related G-protein coupled receptor member B2-like n=1 Tax=Acomys russatus TaxID=60746 RepID=UPI0021E24E3B|nr:mas-related G-protein coupled receptor member B2-like [Acomys russatus]
MEKRNTSGNIPSKDINISSGLLALNENDFGIPQCGSKFQAMILLSLIISLVGMVINGIVLRILGFQIQRNAFSIYILNLAVADFLYLCFQFFFCLLNIICDTDNTNMNSISYQMDLFLYVLPKFPYFSGLSILSVISIERCLSVMWPIWYRCQRPRHTSAVTCVFLWALSLLLCLLEGKACGLLFSSLNERWCKTFRFITGTWSIVLIVVLCGFNLTLLVKIFCGSKRIPVTRLYVTIAFTVLFFLIFCLPFVIYWFVLQLVENMSILFNGFFYDALFLSCVNSCANPIIYFLVGSIRHRRFQWKSLKLLLQRAMQDTPEEEDDGERSPSGNSEDVETV